MKKVFYFTDVLPFLGKGDAALEKLNHNLEIFKEASDKIRLVWHPWSGTEKYMELNDAPVLDEYRSILENFRSEAWGDLDESTSFEQAKEALLGCNGYYGDVSDLVYEAQNAGIPVMLQDIDVR